jgi:hypothetical protein
VDSIQGVYRVQHKIAMYDGSLPPGQYNTVEDVVEIVALPHGDAYLRMHTVFDNGHLCGLHGVAKPEGDALVYRPHDNIEGKCALTLQRKGDQLVFGDKDSACKYDFCGMRGWFDGATLALSSRRPIRYMPRLVASREYAEAMAEQGMAAPPPKVAVKMEPMRAVSALPHYPRMTAFPDTAIRAEFNASMAKAEAEDRTDTQDCIGFLRAHSPADADSYRVDMHVTYLTARYVSISFAANHSCSGTLGNGRKSTIDLSTVNDVGWSTVFKPGFLNGPTGNENDGRLAALYRERYASQNPECRKQVVTQPLYFVLWLDAREGLMAKPQAGSLRDCVVEMALSPQEIAPYVQDARLLADLMATVRT